MQRKTILPALVAWVLLIAVLLGGEALAQAGSGTTLDAGFTLERAVVGAGGPLASGAGFELDATGGQPAAGPATGPDLGLMAGFWGAPLPGGYHVYLPLVLR